LVNGKLQALGLNVYIARFLELLLLSSSPASLVDKFQSEVSIAMEVVTLPNMIIVVSIVIKNPSTVFY
jgi:hypothetical protein